MSSGEITLAQAQTHLSEARTAYTKIMSGQAWSYNGKSVTRADGKFVLDAIKFWNSEVIRLGGSGIKVFRGVIQG